MKRAVRAFVRQRAGRRCEYCQLHEDDKAWLAFHLEHIMARKHHGSDDIANLAWSCQDCNYRKSSDLSGWDLETIEPAGFAPVKLDYVRRLASLTSLSL